MKSNWSIIIPHEINNLFLWPARRAAESWKIEWINSIPSFWDYAKIVIDNSKLDEIYADFTLLENNLEKIIKIIPLPKKIWELDGYIFPWFVSIYMETDEIYESKNFDKYDMLNLIRLIKIKILEAKEKKESLIFSWD